MSVRPHKNHPGKWIIDYYPQGRKGKRVQTVVTGSESDARALELQLRRDGFTAPSNKVNPKIVDVLPEFLNWYKLHRKPRSYKDMVYALKFLVPHFGKLQVNRITQGVVTQYKQLRQDRVRSCNKELTCLQAILKYMVKNNHCNPLPFTIELLPYKQPLPQIPHPGDIQKFIDAVTNPIKKAMVLFMWQCGLRFCDTTNLRWENINWDTNVILVEITKTDPRMCILTKEIKAHLLPFRKDSGYVFENPKTGQPYKSVKTLFRDASKRAGIRRINPHLLRHACGTYMLEATGDLRLVQTTLGHKSVETTQRYTHIATKRLQAGMQATAHYTSDLIQSQTLITKAVKKQNH